MTTDITVLMFLLIIVASMTISSPQNYHIILIGLIAAGLYKCSKSENFRVDGDDADMSIGVPTADFGQTSIVSNEQNTNKWDNGDIVNRMFAREPEPTDGDQKLYDQQKHVGSQAQDAILARSRFTSDNFRPYLQEELDEASKSAGWWEDDNLDSGLVKDGVDYISID